MNKMLWLAPAVAVLTGVLLLPVLGSSASITAAITIWCLGWWIAEPVPIPVTSLLPLALFPLLGVLDRQQVASAYGSPLILLMLGGFILSQAMAATGTHRRLAVTMVRVCTRFAGGSSDRVLVAGFMLAAAALSMWISNTATTLMLLPIALAVLEKNQSPLLPAALMLGIAYAANIGGMGTPIGTPPNLIFIEVYAENSGMHMGFTDWMRWGVPAVVLLLPLAFWWLTRQLNGEQRLELPAVGQWRRAERRVLGVFAITALLWITRSDPWGGWASWFGLNQASDASIALLAAVAIFIVPNGEGGKLLSWEQTKDVPWGILLLFAGGICIAKAFVASGLSAQLGHAFGALAGLPIIAMMLLLCLGVSFLTEATSNMATTTLLMPILAAAAAGANMRPELLMVPATLSASCAFMLPVATAPNAIVFGSGKIIARDMMKTGIALNILCALGITLICMMLIPRTG